VSDDGRFDPDALPTVGALDDTLPGTLELGAFSLSLNVADLGASLDFSTKLGFVATGGNVDDGWLILESFTGVRDIQRELDAAGLAVDPDGNPVRIDRFF
jgi:hypothetical protein